MPSLTALLSKWPLIRQIRERADGTGPEAMSDTTRAMHARIDDAQVARSIRPYCGVGCGQVVYHKDGKLISIEGDAESPISQGNLCPKGAASYQLLTHDRRETKMKYRAPRAKEWTDISPRSRDGHGGRPRLGITQAHVRAQERRRDDQSHDGDLPSRRRYARQQRKFSHPETFHFLILGQPEAYGLPPKPQIPTIYLKSAWTSAFATAIASIIATLVAFVFSS